jgi:hypothetical protein
MRRKQKAVPLPQGMGGTPKLNYEALWKLMADLVSELKKSGESIPDYVMRDLRAAKTMVEILKVDPSRTENLLRIEEYFSKVESYIVPAANRKLGEQYVHEWLSKVAEAQRTRQSWKPQPPKRFPVGVPRDKQWIRLEPTNQLPMEKIKRMSKQLGLKSATQDDGCILIIGADEQVKEFVRRTAQLLRKAHKPR